ncbi:hypothetical protein B0A54_04011 [Friedmanniomyces endolithicus]|uniref:BHLH domain-containing protein n=1 Tax=Friedmanniomyces endolithicus TaxID=329885 RepID=A0A4U0VAE8_9PEZI|nr:hypothetical protein B0A54_04011 [Friedmanniomyces endolithicus]
MNAAVNQPWSQPELDPMAQMSSADLDDLGNLFEFGDIDLNNIPNVDTNPFGDALQQAQNLSHPGTPLNSMSTAPAPSGTSAQDFGGHDQYSVQQDAERQREQYMLRSVNQTPTSHPFTEPMYQPSMQQLYGLPHPQQFQYPQQHGFPPNHHVPPTPNSFDMRGEAGRFMQHQQQQHQLDPQQRAIMEQLYQIRKDDAIAFTPMVSPAGTPQYHMQPEFAVPGAYFSPLTSPMLHAQNAQQTQQHRQSYYTNPSTAPSSNATSPIDLSIDMNMTGDATTSSEQVNPQSRKPRRKTATPRSAGASAWTRQSPISKPQKRKSGSMLSSMVPVGELDTIMAEAQKSVNDQPGSAGLQIPLAFNTSSEDGSISPEPLSESLMGPPPRPGSSLTQSPALSVHRQEAKSAATPKSLLSRKSDDREQTNGGAHDDSSAIEIGDLEDLELPEAAAQQASRPSLKQIDTKVAQGMDSTEQTPRMSARKTPKFGPMSTPSSASALASPSGLTSPISATTPGSLLKDRAQDGKGGRMNKKRSSISANTSNMPSPALRPRISPSIKPLLPEGTALHSPTHALLLASKSNYQNLLEGNHLPGVKFPDSLSTGLTSKRTSHKVAEQGRRNRINDALKEMQALVPKEYLFGKGKHSSDESPEAGVGGEGEGCDGKESKEDAAAKSNSSKASTVESANVYIRNMQRRQAEEAAENEALRRRVEEMERRLTEQMGGCAGVGTVPISGAVEEGGGAAVAASTEMLVDEHAEESASPELVKVL